MEILKNTYIFQSIIMPDLVKTALMSKCSRAKCSSIIMNNGFVIGAGYNSMPCNVVGECFKDSLSPSFKSDKTCCIHAEQRAIMNALRYNPDSIKGSVIYFLRLNNDNQPEFAGKPYCSICSKMALDVGISKFVLWHEDGWVSYDTKEYNELTFQYSGEL